MEITIEPTTHNNKAHELILRGADVCVIVDVPCGFDTFNLGRLTHKDILDLQVYLTELEQIVRE